MVRAVASTLRKELGRDLQVILFGSWAEGTAVPRSDLDIAFDAGRALAIGEKVQLEWLLEDEIKTLRKIDLVDLNRAPERLAENIRKKGLDL